MARIDLNDMDKDVTMTELELTDVRGGGLLLPAVQKVREAAAQKIEQARQITVVQDL